jgi:hypothetical protein
MKKQGFKPFYKVNVEKPTLLNVEKPTLLNVAHLEKI